MNGANPSGSPEPDEALDRLRAADPAAGLEPDLVRLRETVSARIAAQSAFTSDVLGPTVPDELATRRWAPHRWFAVAAVTAGALVVGGASFALGSLVGARPADSVITLTEGGGGDGQEAASAAADSGGERIAADIYPGWPTRIVFTAQGLSDATGTARAWALDAKSVFSKESAERVARILGIEGSATRQYGSWVVGSQDGKGPSLTLSPDGAASVSFYDPTKDPYFCAELAAREDAEAAELRRRCADPDAGDAPRGAQAAAAVRELLAKMGLQVEVEVETTEHNVLEGRGPRMTTATAYQVLGGQRAGLTWSATFVASGVQAFYGPLAPLVSIGDYAVVSENEAVRRLGDPRFGYSGGPVIALAEDTASAAAPEPAVEAPGGGDTAVSSVPADPSGEPTVPPTPEPGAAVPWPVTEVTITKARLGLAQQTLPSGATVLLPAYELADADRQVWSVIAVAEDGLDFSPVE